MSSLVQDARRRVERAHKARHASVTLRTGMMGRHVFLLLRVTAMTSREHPEPRASILTNNQLRPFEVAAESLPIRALYRIAVTRLSGSNRSLFLLPLRPGAPGSTSDDLLSVTVPDVEEPFVADFTLLSNRLSLMR